MKHIIPYLFFICIFSNNAAAQNCNNWLKVNDILSGVTIGDLDISGYKMTIEASFNATGDLTRSLVSKHKHPEDVNYFLLPDLAQMTTSDGFYSVQPKCDYEKNKTYHVAMVYDGKTLKFYRNGFLMAQTKATGRIYSDNDWPTTIGENAHSLYYKKGWESNAFKGYINEVRIWNTDRSQEQIRAYMNSSLPNPSNQPGLLAYYTFDNLVNKQGNAKYNGRIAGNAAIGATNPNCSFVVDSCKVIPNPVLVSALDFELTISKCNMASLRVTKKENVSNLKWNFGDGQLGNKEMVTHVYKKDGNYTITLTAKGINGKEIAVRKSLDISHPDAAFDLSLDEEKKSISVEISNKQKLNYKWLFGDGETSSKTKKVKHIYKADGLYEVNLVAVNKQGCTDTASRLVRIETPAIVVPKEEPKDLVQPKNDPQATASAPLLEKRQNNLVKEIEVTSDSVSVTFYDNAEIDGDSVTIVYNDSVITTHLLLSDKGKTYYLKLNKSGAPNRLIMYAENLGSIPPNTAMMVIYDDKKRYEISISSNTESNGMVEFIFKK